MIRVSEGTVFNAGAPVIVNTVNCKGAMGAGLALEFRLRYPEMFADYAERCRQDRMRIGEPYLYKAYGDPWILNFPTKDHWKDPSRIEWIEAGLKRFVEMYREEGVTSIAFPPLGCTHGGLSWSRVEPLMRRRLEPLDDLTVTLCLDRERRASGAEGRMIGMLNEEEAGGLEECGLPAETAQAIREGRPYARFRDLLRFPGVSRQSYEELFRFFYWRASGLQPDSGKPRLSQGKNPPAEQLTFEF